MKPDFGLSPKLSFTVSDARGQIMTHLIDIDASQPGITRDNNICAGETITCVVRHRPTAEVITVTMGRSRRRCRLWRYKGEPRLRSCVVIWDRLPEGPTCNYNAWIGTSERILMLMRGRQIRLASIQPVGSAPLQTKPALSLSGASATQATVGTYYDFLRLQFRCQRGRRSPRFLAWLLN